MQKEVLGQKRTILGGQHISPLGDLLPSSWEQRGTSDGRTYFTNHDSRTTIWTDPRKPASSTYKPVDDGLAVRKAPRTG